MCLIMERHYDRSSSGAPEHQDQRSSTPIDEERPPRHSSTPRGERHRNAPIDEDRPPRPSSMPRGERQRNAPIPEPIPPQGRPPLAEQPQKKKRKMELKNARRLDGRTFQKCGGLCLLYATKIYHAYSFFSFHHYSLPIPAVVGVYTP